MKWGWLWGGLAALASANAWVAWIRPPGTAGLPGESLTYRWHNWHVRYQVAGQGSPLLLIHGLGAGVHNYEWRHNFLPLAHQHRVYALDLLGAGLSDKPRLHYSASLMAELIQDFARDVIGRPTAAVAASDSAAFLILAAIQQPERFQQLILANPVALSGRRKQDGLAMQALGWGMRLPLIGQSLTNGLTSQQSIRYYLEDQIYYRYSPSPVEIAHYYAIAHLPGTRNLVAAFLKGDFHRDLREIYPALSQPILLAWGLNAEWSPLSDSDPYLHLNANSRLEVFDQSALCPYVEESERFNQVVRGFLAQARVA